VCGDGVAPASWISVAAWLCEALNRVDICGMRRPQGGGYSAWRLKIATTTHRCAGDSARYNVDI
jgi:hypothetical protein